MSKTKTLVLGASENMERYSNIAVRRLIKKDFQVRAIGSRSGKIEDVVIETGMIEFDDIDTVTLYINPVLQQKYYNYILQLKPNRIIFNPGTENEELRQLAEAAGIQTEYACTLVLLNLNQY